MEVRICMPLAAEVLRICMPSGDKQSEGITSTSVSTSTCSSTKSTATVGRTGLFNPNNGSIHKGKESKSKTTDELFEEM